MSLWIDQQPHPWPNSTRCLSCQIFPPSRLRHLKAIHTIRKKAKQNKTGLQNIFSLITCLVTSVQWYLVEPPAKERPSKVWRNVIDHVMWSFTRIKPRIWRTFSAYKSQQINLFEENIFHSISTQRSIEWSFDPENGRFCLQWWFFKKGSNYAVSTGKVLIFWIGSRLRGDRRLQQQQQFLFVLTVAQK